MNDRLECLRCNKKAALLKHGHCYPCLNNDFTDFFYEEIERIKDGHEFICAKCDCQISVDNFKYFIESNNYICPAYECINNILHQINDYDTYDCPNCMYAANISEMGFFCNNCFRIFEICDTCISYMIVIKWTDKPYRDSSGNIIFNIDWNLHEYIPDDSYFLFKCNQCNREMITHTD